MRDPDSDDMTIGFAAVMLVILICMSAGIELPPDTGPEPELAAPLGR